MYIPAAVNGLNISVFHFLPDTFFAFFHPTSECNSIEFLMESMFSSLLKHLGTHDFEGNLHCFSPSLLYFYILYVPLIFENVHAMYVFSPANISSLVWIWSSSSMGISTTLHMSTVCFTKSLVNYPPLGL